MQTNLTTITAYAPERRKMPLGTVRAVLLALDRHAAWAPVRALDLPVGSRVTNALVALCDRGQAERLSLGSHYLYRITPTGRAVAQHIREVQPWEDRGPTNRR